MNTLLTLFVALMLMGHYGVICRLSRNTDRDIKKELLERADPGNPPSGGELTEDFWISLFLIRIRNLDEKKGVMTLQLISRAIWNDSRLAYRNGTSIFIGVPRDAIWTLGVHFFNRALPTDVHAEPPASISFKGKVILDSICTVHLVCIPNLRWFPFDTQRCPLEVGSWDKQGVVLNPEFYHKRRNSTELKIYVRSVLYKNRMKENRQWELMSNEEEIKIQEISPGVRFWKSSVTMVIRRREPLLALSLLCPALTTTLLGLVSFSLRPDQGCRIATTLVSSIVLSCVSTRLRSVAGGGRGQIPFIADLCIICQALLFAASLQAVLMFILAALRVDPPRFFVKTIRLFPDTLLHFCGLPTAASVNFYASEEHSSLVDSAPQFDALFKMSWSQTAMFMDVITLFCYTVVFCVVVCVVIATK